MPDLTRKAPEIAAPGQLGFVTKAPAALGDPFTVTVPGFSEQHFYEIAHWQSRGTTLPEEGDEVLVLKDDREQAWAAAWWPADGDDPVEGKEGPPGEDGEDGAPGSVWYAGEGAPAGGTGINGDLYLRTSNGDVYRKEAGEWKVVGNIKGPEGPVGPEGKAGAEGKEGKAGAAGAEGRWAGLRYTYLTNTEETDPGAGRVKVNAGKTLLRISETDGDGGAIAAYLATFDDSSTTASRGYLILRKIGTPATFAVYKITGALTDKGTWDQIVVELASSGGAFANEDVVSVEFSRTGDTGAEGKAGAEGKEGKTGAEGPAGSPDYKASVRAATTANITISTALNNGDSLDGVTLATGDRVLVKDQTTTKENGIWVVGVSPERATDSDAAGELSGGTQVYVEEGTRNKRRVFYITTAGSITPGTTSHTWAQLYSRDFGLVEALPTSEAVKGDRCAFIANKTDGIIWELVYDDEGEYPWKKVGGPPLINRVDGAGNRNNAAYGDCTGGTTTVPSVTTPLKGDYLVQHGCVAQLTGGASSNGYASVEIGATAAKDEDAAIQISLEQFEGSSTQSGPRLKAGLAASTAVKQKYKGFTNTLTWEYAKRWVQIDPIRVG